MVDTVAVVPVLIGAGTPMVPPPASRTKLSLSGHRLHPKSGIVLLEYTSANERTECAEGWFQLVNGNGRPVLRETRGDIDDYDCDEAARDVVRSTVPR